MPRTPIPAFALVLALAGSFGTAAAQDYSGEYALMTQGLTVLALTLRQEPHGRIRGSVVSGDKSLPITGTVRDGLVSFVTTGSSGGYLQWTGQLQGDSPRGHTTPTGT